MHRLYQKVPVYGVCGRVTVLVCLAFLLDGHADRAGCARLADGIGGGFGGRFTDVGSGGGGGSGLGVGSESTRTVDWREGWRGKLDVVS